MTHPLPHHGSATAGSAYPVRDNTKVASHERSVMAGHRSGRTASHRDDTMACIHHIRIYARTYVSPTYGGHRAGRPIQPLHITAEQQAGGDAFDAFDAEKVISTQIRLGRKPIAYLRLTSFHCSLSHSSLFTEKLFTLPFFTLPFASELNCDWETLAAALLLKRPDSKTDTSCRFLQET